MKQFNALSSIIEVINNFCLLLIVLHINYWSLEGKHALLYKGQNNSSLMDN